MKLQVSRFWSGRLFKKLYALWFSMLNIGCEDEARDFNYYRIVTVNGISIVTIFVCFLYTIYFIQVDALHKYQALFSIPLYSLILYLQNERKHKIAYAIFFWGSLSLLFYWSVENRRLGVEFSLLTLGCLAALINRSIWKASIAFFVVSVAFFTYKYIDSQFPFYADPAFDYEFLRNCLLVSIAGVAFIQLMIFRTLTVYYSGELEVQNMKLMKTLEEREAAEIELKGANTKLHQLTNQLEWIVQQKNSELQTYVDAINVNICSSIIDFEGNFMRVNDPLVKISGYSTQDLAGKNIKFLSAEDENETGYREMVSTVKSGLTWRGEVKNRMKGGDIFWVDQVIIPIKGKDNCINYFLMLALPITGRKQKEETREKTIALLERIAFQTSHNIRGPLARIQGLVTLLQNELIKENEYNSIAEMIGLSSQELNMATSDLVHFVNDHQVAIEQDASSMKEKETTR